MNRYTTLAKWVRKNPKSEMSKIYKLLRIGDFPEAVSIKNEFNNEIVKPINNCFDLYDGQVDVESWLDEARWMFEKFKKAVEIHNLRASAQHINMILSKD